ncbi:hypothetical protein LTR91_010203 [Friedmanniomyces endolithicus]|uniref:FAS1 domain-containing protein n=1 Tax=Friedmanniomyces endolithicus TaxID=329885 RepID=A0A4U0UYN1_9PEZI|nr:hypothetical protein LTS09_001753 [Friedmanniomyces endolithicus]KAK0272189.1 hypothetical protein LTR35_013073 [Friedmanniomyces endolithicus]KAK0283022.1 hypothetical protein LTS00_011847 [Friedmanniomyces endolithicus]KAK0314442.1 hypothetical protein LTR01_001265 [Friedmanniomyces endolithicus]KAK0318323.1 hypothetical protein LTR82_010711 [Friedmanniomyces endolithicus]
MQIKTILPVVLAAAVSAQNATMNLTSLISSNSNLTGLATLLNTYPNAAAGLANATNVTLFAPSNQALQAVESVLGSANGNTNALVAALLSYHTLQGIYYASNISSTPQFPHSMLNNTLYSNVTGGQVVECRLEGSTAEIISGLKSIANVTQANLNFTGGVVHVIDSVLQIPGNFSSVAENANLTALLGAVNATNLTSTLDEASDITIFAPSNSAFQNIASALGNITAAQAAAVLEYHVINGTIAYSSSLANTTIKTLGGANLTITIENGTVFVNSARVVNADILMTGGVMHIIDSVLNPNNTAAANATQSGAATAYSGASSGTAVPFTSGVPTPTTTIVDLVTSTAQVAASYSSVVAAGGSGASTAGAGGKTSSAGAAAMQTGAMGAAALFGGAAFLANV